MKSETLFGIESIESEKEMVFFLGRLKFIIWGES